MSTIDQKPRVAVLGMGTMGVPIAVNLHKAGYRVTVWNRTEEKLERLRRDGIEIAASVADAVGDAKFVLTVVKDAGAVVEVLDMARGAVAPGTVLIQVGTVGVSGFARVAQAAEALSLSLVDAPVQGTRGPAENAQLVVLAAAPSRVRGDVEPIFEAIGKKTLWVSESPGDASKLKVVLNSFISAITHGIAESVRLAESLGVDVQHFEDALSGGPLETAFGSIKLNAIRQRAFTPSFTVDNAIKDSRLVMEAADSSGVWLPLAGAGLARYIAASQAGHGQEDMAASYFADFFKEERKSDA